MQQHLKHSDLMKLVESEDLDQASVDQLLAFFRNDPRLQDKQPDGLFAVDPRNGDRVLFNPARGRRPHDVKNSEPAPSTSAEACAICAGDTTGVVDVAALSQGYTFINKNMFPIMYPFSDTPARGLHFLQWTSNYHRRDWHNLPLEDCQVVMKRLAALERKWVKQGSELASEQRSEPYVSIIKNAGGVVGASLAHGHQQIAVGNVMPRRIQDHLNFHQQHRQLFSRWLLDRLSEDLVVHEFENAVLAVPHFMKRPYDLLLLMRPTEKSYLFELDEAELADAAHGWQLASKLLHQWLPQLGLEPAYNLLVHNGPGAGLYFEFKPHTQLTGGYERMGLYICQGSPAAAAADLRKVIKDIT